MWKTFSAVRLWGLGLRVWVLRPVEQHVPHEIQLSRHSGSRTAAVIASLQYALAVGIEHLYLSSYRNRSDTNQSPPKTLNPKPLKPETYTVETDRQCPLYFAEQNKSAV